MTNMLSVPDIIPGSNLDTEMSVEVFVALYSCTL